MALVAKLGGTLGAMLPARYWSSLDRIVPATGSAVASSVATILAGGTFGIVQFIAHVQRQAGAVNDMILTSPRAAAADDLTTLTLQGVSSLSVLTFLFTPPGIAAAYLTLSGLARAFSATVADGIGDPVLTMVDSGVRRLRAGYSTGRARVERAAREGPQVPDRILRGAHLGVQADLVIVSARRKAGWDRGTIVRSGDHWYRVGTIEERIIDGHLRTLYPLDELRDHGAIRRLVDYDIPAKYRDAGAGKSSTD